MGISKARYAEKLSAAEVMISGLRKHLDKLSRRGIDEAFVESIDSLKKDAAALNNEQESLKARLNSKTDDLNKTLKELVKKVSESKKIVKLDIDSELWKEFGIEDKR
jgi:type II restriction/modification system DNA methylase subunit YeeA